VNCILAAMRTMMEEFEKEISQKEKGMIWNKEAMNNWRKMQREKRT
jgi:hypothetical protein